MRFFSIPTRLVSGLLFGSFALMGCDTNTFPDGTVAFVNAPDEDPWSGAPAVRDVKLEFVTEGSRTTLADVSAPPDPVSIGSEGPRGLVAHFEATGLTDAGEPVVFGSSSPFYVFGFSGTYIPLFMGRKGGFATAPNPFLFPHLRPVTAIEEGSSLLVASAEDT